MEVNAREYETIAWSKACLNGILSTQQTLVDLERRPQIQ